MNTEWEKKLEQMLRHQLNTFFGPGADAELSDSIFAKAIGNTQRCIDAFRLNKSDGAGESEIAVRPMHSLEYCVFLYWISRYSFLDGKSDLASAAYYLNKSLNCAELFYEVKLPEIWFCEHPLGSVMGKAEYGEYFFFYQGCTVGGNIRKDGSSVYPKIGSHVKMLSNSKILGGANIGNNVIISANTYIKDEDVPDNVIVFGQSPNLTFAENHYSKSSSKDNILIR
ncbi:MAG: transferase [Lachnospiraceae bacterium]|nr:transferase [Lachnospiraceae bacterium]